MVRCLCAQLSYWLILTLLATSVAQRDYRSYPPPQGRGGSGGRPKQDDFDFGLTDYGPSSTNFGPSSFGRGQASDPFAPRQPGLGRAQPGPGRYPPGGGSARPQQLDYRPLGGPQGGQAGPEYGFSPPGFGRSTPRDQRGQPGLGGAPYPPQLGGRGGGFGGGQRAHQFSPQQANPRSFGGGDGFFSGGKGLGSSLFPTLGILNGVGTFGSGRNPQTSGRPGAQGGSGLFGSDGENDILKSLGPSARPFDNYRPKNSAPLQGPQGQQYPDRQSGNNSPYPQNPYPSNPYGASRDNRRPPSGQLGPYGRQDLGTHGNPVGSPFRNRGSGPTQYSPSNYDRQPNANPNFSPYQNSPPGQNGGSTQPSNSKNPALFSFPNPFGKQLFGGNIGNDLFSSLPTQGQSNPGSGNNARGSQSPPRGYGPQKPPQGYRPQNNGSPTYGRPQTGSSPYPSPQSQGFPSRESYQPQGNPEQPYPTSPARYGNPSPSFNPQSNANPTSPRQAPSSPFGGLPRQYPPAQSSNPSGPFPPRQQGPPIQYPPRGLSSPNQYPSSRPQSPIQYPPAKPPPGNQSPPSRPQPPNPYLNPRPQIPTQYPPARPQSPKPYPGAQGQGGNPYSSQPSAGPGYSGGQPRPGSAPAPSSPSAGAAATPQGGIASRPFGDPRRNPYNPSNNAGSTPVNSNPKPQSSSTTNINNNNSNSSSSSSNNNNNNNNKPPPPNTILVSFGPAKTDNSKNHAPPPIHTIPAKPEVKRPTSAPPPTPAPKSPPSTTDKYDFLRPRKPNNADFGLDNLFSFPKRPAFPDRSGSGGPTNSQGTSGLLGNNNNFPSFTKNLGNDLKDLFKSS